MEELFALFQNLKSMKLDISSLSGAEKLDRAEKVVKTFWNAIGGDMRELSDSKLIKRYSQVVTSNPIPNSFFYLGEDEIT